jgi:hypothetical protein
VLVLVFYSPPALRACIVAIEREPVRMLLQQLRKRHPHPIEDETVQVPTALISEQI